MSQFFSLSGASVLVIGGSSGIGLSVAELALAAGASVTIAARDQAKLDQAAKQLGNSVAMHRVDISSDASVAALFEKVGRVQHLAITGPAPGFGPFRDLSLEQVRADFDAKFWGQYRAVQHAMKHGLPDDGSVTLMSGAYSARPVAGATTLAAIQAGLEGLARGLAIDLAPVRVNAVSPGLTVTPLINGAFGDAVVEDLYKQTAANLPSRRVNTAKDIAELYLFLMANRSMTGSTLFPDGGYTLR
jgi:NAD(P)-dependent dehydrogenase (short-subunit alcohol dehydrogenase family)